MEVFSIQRRNCQELRTNKFRKIKTRDGITRLQKKMSQEKDVMPWMTFCTQARDWDPLETGRTMLVI